MTRPVDSDVQERNQSLWALALPPLIWFAYFVAGYSILALKCGALGGGDSAVSTRIGVAIATVLAIAGIALAGRAGWRRYKYGSESADSVPSHHRDSPEDRHRFLGLATFLLAALSAIATLYVGMALLMVPQCR